MKRKKRCEWCERASKAQGLGSCLPCTVAWEKAVRKLRATQHKGADFQKEKTK